MHRTSPKIVGWRGVSQVFAPPEAQVGEGILGQGVKSAGGDVFSELSIPSDGIERCEPFPKLGQILRRQFLHGALELSDAAHIMILQSLSGSGQ